MPLDGALVPSETVGTWSGGRGGGEFIRVLAYYAARLALCARAV